MRWTSSVLNVSVAPMLKLTGGLLSRPLRNGGDRLHGSSWRLLAHGGFRCNCGCGGRSGRLLFREALLEGFHQVDHRSHVRLGHLGYFLALELGGDHVAQVLLIFVAILLRLERSSKTLDELLRELLFLILYFDLVGR